MFNRRTYIILVLDIILLGNCVLSQTSILERKVTIEFKNTKIESAINILNKKMDHILSFKNKIFPKNRTVTLKVINVPLKEVLDKIFLGTKIKYFESGKQIVLQLVDSEDKKTDAQSGKGSPLSADDFQSGDDNQSITCRNIESEELIISSFMTDIKKSEKDSKALALNNTNFQNIVYLTEPPLLSQVTETSVKPRIMEESSPLDLSGRHSISFEPGFKTNSKTTISTGVTNFSANVGATGSVSYSYWFDNEWALHVQAGVFAAEANIQNTNVSANSIIPVLFGLRYYPSSLSFWDFGKIYFGASVGAYIGTSVSVANNLSNISGTETKFGVQPIIGLDLFLTSWLKMGPSIAYHLLGAYSQIFTEKKNYSGMEGVFSMGIVL